MERCAFEFASIRVKVIKNNGLMNPGIKLEILRRIDRCMSAYKNGMIPLREVMKLLSTDCCREGEDMSAYAI